MVGVSRSGIAAVVVTFELMFVGHACASLLVSFGAILMPLHGCACLESPVLSDAAQRLPLLAATSCHIFPLQS